MQSFTMFVLSALLLLASKASMASTCDLRITPEIIERQDQVTVETFWTGTDRTRGERRRHYSENRQSQRPFGAQARRLVGSGENSSEWYQAKKAEAITECQDYIRENFADDIIQDTEDSFVARHYHCQERRNSGTNRVQIGATLIRSRPVYAELGLEQALAQKCQKLTQCLLDASDASELEQLQQTQVQLGCQ